MQDGLPEREIVWHSGPSRLWTIPRSDGSFILGFDTATSRAVATWTADELLKLAEKLYRRACGGLTVEDAAELATIDPQDFVEH